MKQDSITRRQGLAMLGAAAAASTFPKPALAQKLDRVTLAIAAAVAGSDTTLVYAGQALGFFKEEGIDLDVEFGQGVAAATSLVASGAMDTAAGGLEALPGFVIQNVPMKAFYVYANRPIFLLGFLKTSKIQTIASLRGARVGVLNLSSGAIPVLQFILKEAGLTLDDVQLTPVGVGAAALAAIKGNQIDALMYYDTGFVSFEQQGVGFNYYSSPRLNQGYPGIGFVALEKTLRDRKSTFQALSRAMTKCAVYAIKDPVGATKAFAQLYPEIGKSIDAEVEVWKRRASIIVPSTQSGNRIWGTIDNADVAWNNLLDVLTIGGVIKQRPPVSSLYTTDFTTDESTIDLSKLR